MKKRSMKERVFKCETCGNKMIAYKRAGRNTSQGHIKHMYCFICKDRKAHIQQSKWD